MGMGRAGRESRYLVGRTRLGHERLDGCRIARDFAGWDYTVCRTMQEGGDGDEYE